MKLLLLAFSQSDADQSGGFIQSLGLEADAILVANQPADALAASLVEKAKEYSHIAAVSSMQSKDALAYLAGVLDCAMVTDALGVVSPSSYKRPIFAGSMIATVETAGQVVVTFRPSGFAKVDGPIATSFDQTSASKVTVTNDAKRATGRPDLGSAKIVVSGGRPLKTADQFEAVIGGFADSLGAAVGATRAAVDSGIAPNELQVGQTGKVVAPDLYIAAGISGSTQHMAGIKDSKLIVAINTDVNAPIFEVADLGLVGDLYQVLPELQNLLKQ